MRRGRIGALIITVGLLWACSRKTPPEAAAPTPSYSAVSIAPSGERRPGPLAPGRVATIYGRNLGPAEPCHGEPDPVRRETPNPSRPNQTDIETQIFPTRLCETEVQVGGLAAGLLYVSPGQINFKMPQTVNAQGEIAIRVVHKGQAGASVSVAIAVDSGTEKTEAIAARMWSDLQAIKWARPYSPAADTCAAVPALQAMRYGLHGHAYYCAQQDGGVIAESLYYPVDHERPKLLLLRADIRPRNAYPELSAEVEQLLIRRLDRAYGAGSVPDHVYEIGATRPEPGQSWRTGKLTIFLHRNRSHIQPVGVRQGVILIAVREEILEQRRIVQRLDEEFRFVAASQPPKGEEDRVKAVEQTKSDLLRLLKDRDSNREQRATNLVAADGLARRMGGLLVAPNGMAEGAGKVRLQLASHDVRFGEIGHYSGELNYDHSLLWRAWKEYPDTGAGQRAFLKLQRLGCATPRLGCDGPNCFKAVIQQGEQLLADYPDTAVRKQQLHHLALAYETWWSLAQAAPGDITAEGAKVTEASGEQARQRAIALYEDLLSIAPAALEADAARLALPRLKLKLDSFERTFFCFSC